MNITIESGDRFRSAQTSDFCLLDLKCHPDDALVKMGGILSEAVSAITRKDVRISWMNILDKEFNPDGNRGFFHVSTERENRI